MKKLAVLLLLFASVLHSQESFNIADRPLKGSTFIPKGLFVTNVVSFNRATSYFDSESKRKSFIEAAGRSARPVESIGSSTLIVQAGFSEKVGMSVTIPFIFSHTGKLNAEPGYDEVFQNDKSGDHGPSDIWANMMFLVWRNEYTQLQVSGGVKFPTGSFPEEINEIWVSSTGSGNYEADLSISADNLLYKNLLLSVKTGFSMSFGRKLKDGGSSQYYDVRRGLYIKPGSKIHIQGAASYSIGDFAFGTAFLFIFTDRTKYYTSGEDLTGNDYYLHRNIAKYDGKNSLIIEPAAAVSLLQGIFPLDLALSYSYLVIGKSVTGFNSISIGISKPIGY